MPRHAIDNLILELPPLLCGDVAVYALINAFKNHTVDNSRRFDKRFKAAHRFDIADTRGRLSLTVPIAKPQTAKCPWEAICVSTHGAWWDVHRTALESAYGRTPYFEFYIDRLMPMLTVGVEERFPTVTSLSEAWNAEIRHILDLPDPLAPDENVSLTNADSARIDADTVLSMASQITTPPYYQLRADKLGFISGLSVLDLIFNLGPEAQLYLDSLIPQAKALADTSI